MNIFQSKYKQLPGTSHAAVIRLARREYHGIQKMAPRRQAYVRSAYFVRGKVFINTFWEHLKQKHWRDQTRRAKLLPNAVDLMRNTSLTPEIKVERSLGSQLYRFYGKTKDGQLFCVQVKHNLRTDRKDFISVFPVNKLK